MDVAHFGTRFSGEHMSAGLMAGLDLRVLFQHKKFYDSMAARVRQDNSDCSFLLHLWFLGRLSAVRNMKIEQMELEEGKITCPDNPPFPWTVNLLHYSLLLYQA